MPCLLEFIYTVPMPSKELWTFSERTIVRVNNSKVLVSASIFRLSGTAVWMAFADSQLTVGSSGGFQTPNEHCYTKQNLAHLNPTEFTKLWRYSISSKGFCCTLQHRQQSEQDVIKKAHRYINDNFVTVCHCAYSIDAIFCDRFAKGLCKPLFKIQNLDIISCNVTTLFLLYTRSGHWSRDFVSFY